MEKTNICLKKLLKKENPVFLKVWWRENVNSIFDWTILYLILLSLSFFLCLLVTQQYIKEFYNRTVVSRNGTGLNEEALTLMYSLTVSVFAIGGLIGSLMVGTLVTRFGR